MPEIDDWEVALQVAGALPRPHNFAGNDAKALLEDASEVLAWIRAAKKENPDV